MELCKQKCLRLEASGAAPSKTHQKIIPHLESNTEQNYRSSLKCKYLQILKNLKNILFSEGSTKKYALPKEKQLKVKT